MYDSPIEHCSVCCAWVALDQAPRECAHGHQCGRDASQCPLAAYFVTPEPSIGRSTNAEERGQLPDGTLPVLVCR